MNKNESMHYQYSPFKRYNTHPLFYFIIILLLPMQCLQADTQKDNKNSQTPHTKTSPVTDNQSKQSTPAFLTIKTDPMRKHPKVDEPSFSESILQGINISGQATVIYQSSSLNRKRLIITVIPSH